MTNLHRFHLYLLAFTIACLAMSSLPASAQYYHRGYYHRGPYYGPHYRPHAQYYGYPRYYSYPGYYNSKQTVVIYR